MNPGEASAVQQGRVSASGPDPGAHLPSWADRKSGWVNFIHLCSQCKLTLTWCKNCPQLMAESSNPKTLTFYGERTSWVSPTSLDELVQLKSSNPKAPLVMGNTNVGEKSDPLHSQSVFLQRSRSLITCSVWPNVFSGCSSWYSAGLHVLKVLIIPFARWLTLKKTFICILEDHCD